jgi:hypothetical protein
VSSRATIAQTREKKTRAPKKKKTKQINTRSMKKKLNDKQPIQHCIMIRMLILLRHGEIVRRERFVLSARLLPINTKTKTKSTTKQQQNNTIIAIRH